VVEVNGTLLDLGRACVAAYNKGLRLLRMATLVNLLRCLDLRGVRPVWTWIAAGYKNVGTVGIGLAGPKLKTTGLQRV
jgi:hypothetical protein